MQSKLRTENKYIDMHRLRQVSKNEQFQSKNNFAASKGVWRCRTGFPTETVVSDSKSVRF